MAKVGRANRFADVLIAFNVKKVNMTEEVANVVLAEEEVILEEDDDDSKRLEEESEHKILYIKSPVAEDAQNSTSAFKELLNIHVSEEEDSDRAIEEGDEKKTCLQIYGFERIGFICVVIVFEVFMFFVAMFLFKNGQDKFIDDAGDDELAVDTTVGQYYVFFIHVAMMIFIGFGLLMAFLRKGGFLAMGMGFLLACVASHWALFVVGYAEILTELVNEHRPYEFIVVDVPLMIKSLFASGAILISMGCVIGKLSPFQMIIFVLLEIPIYAFNVSLVEGVLHVSDVGGSMLIHTFGAYFGLAMSWMATPREILKDSQYTDKLAATRTSDVFSMLGTLVLWVYWPSFCGALEGEYQHRTIVNTYLALSSGCIIVFALSRLIRLRFGMPEIQNSTLAAGVAIGTAANMDINPGAAVGIGLLAGIVSMLGYKFIQPFLQKVYLHDSCGVHNLHGMPGIIGGIAGVFASIRMKDELHHEEYQPLIQLAGLCITIGISLVGGLCVGGLLRVFKLLYPKEAREFFEDDVYFKLEEEKEQEEYDRSVIKNEILEKVQIQIDQVLDQIKGVKQKKDM